MADDNKDNPAPDLWSGIDSDESGSGELSTDFSFTFDTVPDTIQAADAPPGENSPTAAAAASADEDIASDDSAEDGDPNLSDVPDDALVNQSSAIQIGTGHSGIVSNDEWDVAATGSGLDAQNAAAESTSESNGFADFPDPTDGGDFPSLASDVSDETSQGINVEDPDAADSGANDDPWGSTESAEEKADENGEDFQPEPDAIQDAAAFGGLPTDEDSDFSTAGSQVASMAATASVKKKTKSSRAARAKPGGIGQMIGVVLGGLMALPITYAILIWGFQKDPFKLAKLVPPEVAFLLPQKFQPGYTKPANDSVESRKKGSPLDNLPTGVGGVTETVPASGEEEDGMDSKPANPAGGSVASGSGGNGQGQAVAPSAPEPLDLSQLTAAVKKASAASVMLADLDDPADPKRKKMLVGWYKSLATVGEELVMLETVAADAGQPLEQVPAAVIELSAQIAANGAIVKDLSKLGKMWLEKRPSNGVAILATLEASRQVGPYWCSQVSLASAESRKISIISRTQPLAVTGDQIIVLGVLLDGDVIWSGDCRQLQAEQVKPPTVEDLF